MKLTEEELARRKPVWIALSDLFLDTDVTLHYDYIVRTCSDSTYSLDELKLILQNEVTPAVSGNMLNVAGEWAGFNEAWLVRTINRKLRVNGFLQFFFIKPIRNVFFRKYIQEHWAELEPRIVELRKGA